jgi:uncharacterized membrane protein
MAIAELTRGESLPLVEVLDEASNVDASVRLEVHDASRLEWSISIPLPDSRPLSYAIDVELEIPANAFAQHTPWEQLQSFTRLDGPELSADSEAGMTIDGLRRRAVAVANRLGRASEAITRHCVLAGSLFATAPRRELVDGLLLWVEAAHTTAVDCTAGALREDVGDVAILRERELVEEYASVRFLELLAAAERSLAQLAHSKSAHVVAMATDVAEAESKVAQRLAEELARRGERGWICADAGSAEALEQYIDRASRLKKHFQEVLFLEPETFHVAERIRHWVAAFVALVASTWAFAWQLFLANHAKNNSGSTAFSGLALVAVTAGVVYATKDRIKEVGRAWISGHVHRFYAERVARYRAPARRLKGRDVIVAARESCGRSVTSHPDPLNPESGAAVPVTMIRYEHRGRVFPRAALAAQGVRRIKHVFRYDFSPLFARLDDAVKPVPVLDAETRRVRFAQAARCYRVPVVVRVECAGAKRHERATLVLTKRGLDRLERRVDAELEAEAHEKSLDLF